MANKILFEDAAPSGLVLGDPVTTDGGKNAIHITADSYGSTGKVILNGSADGTIFTPLSDPNTVSGLAEYSADIIVLLDKLGQGWQVRADFDADGGTDGTNVKVTLATN